MEVYVVFKKKSRSEKIDRYVFPIFRYKNGCLMNSVDNAHYFGNFK